VTAQERNTTRVPRTPRYGQPLKRVGISDRRGGDSRFNDIRVWEG
jgi:hypothetical protein